VIRKVVGPSPFFADVLVDDLNAAIAELGRNGIVTGGPTVTSSGTRCAFIDAEKYEIELIERKRR
jgi:hypothetical protein